MDASRPLDPTCLPQPAMINSGEPITRYLGRCRLDADILGKYLWFTQRLSVTPSAINKLQTRNIYRYIQGKPEISWVTIYFSKMDAWNCVMTHDALMTKFFGLDSYKKMQKLNNRPELGIEELKNRLLSREASSSLGARLHSIFRGHFDVAPDPLNADNWTICSVKIYKGGSLSQECLHAFAVLQAVENETVVYKILQSYIGLYEFNQHDITYSSNEILSMLDELGELFSSPTWNAQNLHLFSHYFKNSTLPNEGKKISFERRLELRIGVVTRPSFEAIAQQYRGEYPRNFRIKVSKS